MTSHIRVELEMPDYILMIAVIRTVQHGNHVYQPLRAVGLDHTL